jgi:flagellar biosynthetic protein FliR
MSSLAALHDILTKLDISADPGTFAALFTLLMARTAAALWSAPFLGGRAVPGGVRIALSGLIALLLYAPAERLVPDGGWPAFLTFAYVALLLKELLVGAVIGLAVQVLFSAIETAGLLIEYVAGLKMEQILAPQLPSGGGALSVLLGQSAIVIYLIADIHLLLLRAIADTYHLIPLFSFPAFRAGLLPLADAAAKISGGFFSVAFQIAAPGILVVALVRVGSNLVFRVSFAAVQSDPFQPLASMAALGVLLLAAGMVAEETIRLGTAYVQQLRGFVHSLL